MPPFREPPAFVRNTSRALERLVEPQRPKALEQRVVARDGAWDRCGVDAVLRHASLGELVGEELRSPTGWRPASRIERVEFFVLGNVDEGEQVAPDPRVVLRGDVQNGAGGDRRV